MPWSRRESRMLWEEKEIWAKAWREEDPQLDEVQRTPVRVCRVLAHLFWQGSEGCVQGCRSWQNGSGKGRHSEFRARTCGGGCGIKWAKDDTGLDGLGVCSSVCKCRV